MMMMVSQLYWPIVPDTVAEIGRTTLVVEIALHKYWYVLDVLLGFLHQTTTKEENQWHTIATSHHSPPIPKVTNWLGAKEGCRAVVRIFDPNRAFTTTFIQYHELISFNYVLVCATFSRLFGFDTSRPWWHLMTRLGLTTVPLNDFLPSLIATASMQASTFLREVVVPVLVLLLLLLRSTSVS